MLKKPLLLAVFLLLALPLTSACLTSNQVSLITQLALKNNLSVEDTVDLFEQLCNKSLSAKDLAEEINDTFSQQINNLSNKISVISQLKQQINETNMSLNKRISNFTDFVNETYVKKDTFIQSNNVLMHKIEVVNSSLNANLAEWLDSQIEEALKEYPNEQNFSALKDEIDTRFENYNKDIDSKVNLLGTQLTRNITLELVDMIPKKQTSAIWLSILGIFVASGSIGFTAWQYQKNRILNRENMEAIKTGAKVTYKTIYDNTKDWEDHLVQLRTSVLKNKEIDKHAKVELMKLIDRGIIQNDEDIKNYSEQFKLMKKEGIDLSEIQKIREAVNGKAKK